MRSDYHPAVCCEFSIVELEGVCWQTSTPAQSIFKVMAGILPLLIALITAHAADLQPSDLDLGNDWIVLASLGLFSVLHVLVSMLLARLASYAAVRFGIPRLLGYSWRSMVGGAFPSVGRSLAIGRWSSLAR